MSQSHIDGSGLGTLEARLAHAVTDEEPWALLERFAGLSRLSGTPDEVRAAEYIMDRLDEFGVSYERYDPELYLSQPHGASLTTLNKEFEPGPLKTVSFSASTTVSGPVEYVGAAGSSILDDTDSLEPNVPYENVGDLSGTIALTDAGSLSIRATTRLAEKGAIGVIAIHEHEREPHNGIASPIWGGAPRLDQKNALPDVPIVNVNLPDGTVLREWADSDEGLQVELQTDLTTDWFECPVVVAEIQGSANTDDFVLLHGHYDSWYVGITDNATGDAGLLECARVFEKFADDLQRNLRIAWWPGHSTGRYAGSTWYADEFALDMEKHCVAQVNMDSPGAKGATEYTDMSCWTPESHALVTGAVDDVTGAPSKERFPFRAGDYSFDNLGITGFLMLSSNIPSEEREKHGYHTVGGCGGNSNAWHVSTDTLEKAGRDELIRDIQLYIVSVLRVLNAEILPFDHARNVDAIHSAIRGYDEIAGNAFDFGPTLSDLRDIRDRLDEFQEAVRAGEIAPETANRVITRLSRILTRIYLVEDGQFEQDPATGRDPVPRLAPAKLFPTLNRDDTRFLQVQLKREQNAIRSEVRRARELIAESRSK